MRSATRSLASLATSSSSSRSEQNAFDRQRRGDEALVVECLLNANSTKEPSNETQDHIDHYVFAFDPPLLISLGGRSRTGDGAGRALKPRRDTHPRRLAVRNAGARGRAM